MRIRRTDSDLMRASHTVIGVALLIAVIGLPSLAVAQGKVDVRWERNTTIRVSQARSVARFDLAQDIVGCVGVLYDGSTNKRFGSALGKTQVVDVASNDGEHFVLVSAAAAPNCNVQGRCGAGDDNVTLIWLHLGSDLSLAGKQAFAVEDCVASRWVEDQPDDFAVERPQDAWRQTGSQFHRKHLRPRPSEPRGV